MTHNWSQYQLAIFDDAENGEGNTVVEALAGSAKSSSLVEVINRLNKKISWFSVAFNVKIVDELKKKISNTKNGQISTIHSYGLKCLYKTFDKVTVDQDKTATLIAKTLGKKIKDKNVIYQLIETVRKAKLTLSSSKEEIDALIDRFEIDLFEYPEDDFINHVQFLLNLSKKYFTIVDMEDMIWLPCVLAVETIKYDFVLVDEAQDMTKAARKLILKSCKKGGRIFVFGDPNQAIMGWAGADSDSMKQFENELNAKVLPLPICYRCPKRVVSHAQKYVPELQPWEHAKEGFVCSIKEPEMMKKATPGCFILSRYNAPLLSLAMKFISEGRPCNILGRNIGQNLSTMIKQSKCKSIDKFLIWLEKWKNREYAKLISKKKDATWILDRFTCLNTLSESCESLKEMKDSIDKLFTDVDVLNRITLSSIHRSKGLENTKVFILAYTLRKAPQEEKNLAYVANTRSQSELYLVYKDKKDKKEKQSWIDESSEEISEIGTD